MRILFLVLVVFSSAAFPIGNETILNFTTAKRLALGIFGDESRTLYCDCVYRDKKIDYRDCDFKPQKDLLRAARLEWEHVVPASKFGRTFDAWSKGHPRCERKGKPYKGRRCADKVSDAYRKVASDLYNLFPSVGEVNGFRENFKMGEIKGEVRRFGLCDFEVSAETVEPRDAVKGEVARTYLYMIYSYPNRVILDQAMAYMLQDRDRLDPVDETECDRYLDIFEIQGNDNPILRQRCMVAGYI